MSETKDTHWIDFSKLPVDTLVDVVTPKGVVTAFFVVTDDEEQEFVVSCLPSVTRGDNYDLFDFHKKVRISAKNPWLPWFGGECPVPENCMVETILRTKRKLKDEAWIVDWLHFEKSVEDNEVIAYRLLESPWQTIDGVCDE